MKILEKFFKSLIFLFQNEERKSIRKSTAAKSAETAYRIKVRHMEQKKRTKKNILDDWMPTQDELLEEAKLTEIENLKSLGK